MWRKGREPNKEIQGSHEVQGSNEVLGSPLGNQWRDQSYQKGIKCETFLQWKASPDLK